MDSGMTARPAACGRGLAVGHLEWAEPVAGVVCFRRKLALDRSKPGEDFTRRGPC